MLEYFCCMIGNTAEAWSYCSSRSDNDMLQVWFSCSPFVPSNCGIKMVDGYYTRGLHQGQATFMPSLAAISAVVTLQFPRIIA
jgi:hypothetical protein